MEFPIRGPRKASRILLLLTLWAEMSRAQPCRQWGAVKEIGSLPLTQVREASGLALSLVKPERAYWINDSGNKTRIYYGDLAANGPLKAIDVTDFKSKDSEALVATMCDSADPCLILGDIGDNFRRRKSIQLAFFKDLAQPPATTKPERILTLTYPNGAHDAEAMFIGEDGSLFLVTKELHFLPPGAGVAQVFQVPRKIWQDPSIQSFEMIPAGELNLPTWLKDRGFLAQVVTDAHTHLKRKVVGLLTYGGLIEIPLERMRTLKDHGPWQRDKDYFVVPIHNLSQQETLAYTADDRVIWSTEFFPPKAPIFSMTCQRVDP